MSTVNLFHHQRIVRFGECDPAGVAYYPEFFNWFHQAMEAFFEERLKVSYAKIIQTTGFPAVHTSAEFRKPLPVGTTIDVVVGVEKLGRSSVSWRFEVCKENGQVAAVGRVKTVCIAVSEGEFAFQSVEIPTHILSGLQSILIDQA